MEDTKSRSILLRMTLADLFPLLLPSEVSVRLQAIMFKELQGTARTPGLAWPGTTPDS